MPKDLLTILNKDLETFQLNSFIRDIKIVPESKKADSLLEEFKKDRSHMAIVIDEYGTISGLVTIEDILEDIFVLENLLFQLSLLESWKR